MKNAILLLFVCGGLTLAYAQNLVPNPGFERNSACPNNAGQWFRVDNWTNSTSGAITSGVGAGSSPDYFHACGGRGFRPPFTSAAFIYPRTGNAMMGLTTYRMFPPNWREYIGVRLDSVLQPGTPYEVEFYYSNGINTTPSRAWFGNHGTQLGVHFSNAPLVQLGAIEPILLPTDYETPSPIYSSTWQRIAFTFTPSQPVAYINIGNFRNDSTTLAPSFAPSGLYPQAYYYIDDVSVTRSNPLASQEVSEPVLEVAPETADRFYYYENSLYFQSQDTEPQRIKLTVMDMSGKQVLADGGVKESAGVFDCSKLGPGSYIAQLQRDSGIQVVRFLKH